MAELRTCPACAMEFDWPGVAVGAEEFCCAACARGEECTCPQHHHSRAGAEELNAAAAAQLGVRPGSEARRG